MISEKTIAYIVGGGAVLFSIGWSTYQQNQLKKQVDKLGNKIHIDVEDSYVCNAVDRVIDREVNKKINSAANRAIEDTKREMSKQISKEVKAAYSDVRKDVKAELMKQVGEVNINSIRNEVIEEARIAAVDKFKGDMDDVLKSYSADLENVRKIHESIANTLSGGNEKRGTTLTIG